MKKQHLLSIVFAAGILGLSFSSSAWAANDPIPGIDIVVRPSYGGVPITGSTNQDGSFTFDNLKPGQYELTVVPPKTGDVGPASNYDQNNLAVTQAPDGSTLVNVSLSLCSTPKQTPFEPINLTIGPKGGKISGRISGIELSEPVPARGIVLRDLGVDAAGILPTSIYYPFKQLGRGLLRIATTDPIARTELELSITNQVAAEVLEVEKAYEACAANALGGGKSCDSEGIGGSLTGALRNFTNAQKQLIASLSALNDTSKNPKVAKLLTDIDAKTATHAALLDQLDREHASNPEYRSESMIQDVDHHYIVATFVAAGEKEASAKQKAADGIARVEKSVKQAETTVFGQAVTFTASIVDDRGAGFVKSIATPGAGTPTGSVNFTVTTNAPGVTVTSVGVPIPFLHIIAREVCARGNPCTSATGSSTGSDGSYTFTGLMPGTYDLSIAGQIVKKITVGTEGTIRGFGRTGSCGAFTFSSCVGDVHANAIGSITAVINGGDLLINVTTTSGLAVGNIIRIDNELMLITAMAPTSISVSRGANGSAAGAHLPGARIDLAYYLGTPNFIVIVIANAKGDLASAKTAFADGTYGESFGLARSAEVLAASVETQIPSTRSLKIPVCRPTAAQPEAPKPSVTKPTAPPTVKPIPSVSEPPKPTVTEPPVSSVPPPVSSTPEKTAPPPPSVSEPPVSSVPPPVSSTPGKTETPPPSTRIR